MTDFKCSVQPCLNAHEYSNTGKCKYHYLYGDDKPEKKKEVKPIPRESKKRAKENREDQKQNRELREIIGKCQLRLTGCTGKADCIHHPDGRIGKRLTDVKQKLVSCYSCNLRAETHPNEAREKGVLNYKHKKNQQ